MSASSNFGAITIKRDSEVQQDNSARQQQKRTALNLLKHLLFLCQTCEEPKGTERDQSVMSEDAQ